MSSELFNLTNEVRRVVVAHSKFRISALALNKVSK